MKKKEKVKKIVLSGKPLKIMKANIPVTSLKKEERYIKTHVPGLDELLGEGIPKGSAVLVEGGPGNGKTILCLNMIRTLCERGKKVLFMSFEEPEERLREHLSLFGVDAPKFEKNGTLYLKRFNALDIARSVEALLSEAKKELLIDVQPVLIPQDFQPDIVLIDSLSSISSAFSGESSRFRIYMEQLFRYLEGHNITSFLIREVANPTHIGTTFSEVGEAVSFLSDGIIILYNVFEKSGHRKRALEVLKMRGADISRKIVEFEIKKGKGVIVYPNKVLVGDYVLT
jgi:circadian clock protein KaiC